MSQNVPQCPEVQKHSSPAHPAESPRQLSPIQLRALALLAAGNTDTAIARKLHLNRKTLNRWRLFDPLFASRLNRLRKAIWANTLDRLRHLLPSSLAVLAHALRDDNPATRLRAAIQLLKIAGASRLATRIGPDNVSDVLMERFRQHLQAEYSPARLRTLEPPSRDELDEFHHQLLRHIAQEEAVDAAEPQPAP